MSFNDRVTAHDVVGLAALMTDDHAFVDSEGTAIEGKAECVEAWRVFFAEFPDYQNVFASARTDGEVVTVVGHSECSEPALAGPAIWTVVVRDGLVARWQVSVDSPETPAALGRPS